MKGRTVCRAFDCQFSVCKSELGDGRAGAEGELAGGHGGAEESREERVLQTQTSFAGCTRTPTLASPARCWKTPV